MPLTAEKRKEAIDTLITNGCGCWKEEDRTILNSFADTKLESLITANTKAEQFELVANAAITGFEDQQGNSHKFNSDLNRWESILVNVDEDDDDQEKEGEKTTPKKKEEGATMNSQGLGLGDTPITTEQWLSQAPPEVQSIVQNALSMEKAQKTQLIDQLTANIQGDKSDLVTMLGQKSLSELKTLSKISSRPVVANWDGASVPSGMTNNTSEFTDADILPLPSAF